jgi:hypothetical protein
VALAAAVAPDGGVQRHGAVRVFESVPAWSHLLEKVQFYDLLATAGANKTGGPGVCSLTRNVDSERAGLVWQIVNVLEPIKPDAWAPMIQSPKTRDEAKGAKPGDSPECKVHDWASLRAGIDSNGVTSP